MFFITFFQEIKQNFIPEGFLGGSTLNFYMKDGKSLKN